MFAILPSGPTDRFPAMTVDVPSDIGAVATSHDALLRTIEHLDDARVRQPSLLPDWSLGHVLTHVARNADGLANLARWARSGIRTPMYESRDRRDADIEAGSGRGVGEIRADLVAAQQRFLDSLAGIADVEVLTPVTFGRDDRATTAAELPMIRMSEVEIHHVDLGSAIRPRTGRRASSSGCCPGSVPSSRSVTSRRHPGRRRRRAQLDHRRRRTRRDRPGARAAGLADRPLRRDRTAR